MKLSPKDPGSKPRWSTRSMGLRENKKVCTIQNKLNAVAKEAKRPSVMQKAQLKMQASFQMKTGRQIRTFLLVMAAGAASWGKLGVGIGLA